MKSFLFGLFIGWLFLSCNHEKPSIYTNPIGGDTFIAKDIYFITNHDITIGDYFCFIDSLLLWADDTLGYKINEYTLLHRNKWMIQALAASDYYLLKENGISNYDNRSWVIVHAGDTVYTPNEVANDSLQAWLHTLKIDVNIPEYTMRIYNNDNLLFQFKIRVGQNKTKYLKLTKRETSLITDTGSGIIIRIDKEPYFINPVDGKHFVDTRRDDDIVTKMPLIPWIETEINHVRNGDMIHPTTNLKTLGRAYSNGCMGLRESDAWILYYHAPIGTPIHIRYDLKSINTSGDTSVLKDIYYWKINK